MTKAELQKELKELEIRKDVVGSVIADLRRQYDSLNESILLTKRKMERIENEERRLKQSMTEKEMKKRMAQAASKRRQQGYRLGSSIHDDNTIKSEANAVKTEDPEAVRDPIPQKKMRLMD